MLTYLLSWLFSAYGSLAGMTLQVDNTIKISGSCYEPATGRDLEVRAFAVFKGSKIALGQSKLEGIFNRFALKVPDSTKFLSFEANGFHTMTVPVNFIGKIDSNFDFGVLIPMSAKDSLPIIPSNCVYFQYIAPDSMDVRHEFKNLLSTERGLVWDFKHKYNKGKHQAALNTCYWPSYKLGRYSYKAFSSDETLLLDEEIVLSAGINFKVIKLNKPSRKLVEKAAFDTKTLYFDQSKAELRNEVKSALDSVAKFLSDQPQMILRITGYTDNVGDAAKNVILSEYRAKTVANYLMQKGIQTSQILVIGKGGESPVASNESEATKILNRRVTIEFLGN